jgi:hypothetical protein
MARRLFEDPVFVVVEEDEPVAIICLLRQPVHRATIIMVCV